MAIEKSLFGDLSTDSIKSFEMSYGAALPEDYKRFLLVSNGGEPLPNEIDVPNQQPVLVDLLYGISDKREPGDLEYEVMSRSETLPKNFLPIGHDPGGNTFLLSVEPSRWGRIYYWDSCCFFEDSDENQNTYLVADNISDFLQSLH
jgi:hypothetical protein